jgi:hypothetical protein
MKMGGEIYVPAALNSVKRPWYLLNRSLHGTQSLSGGFFRNELQNITLQKQIP